MHWYLSQKGQLELVKAVRYALDIARYVHFFKTQEILVQKEKENICNVHVFPFMMYLADHVSVSLCIICQFLVCLQLKLFHAHRHICFMSAGD